MDIFYHHSETMFPVIVFIYNANLKSYPEGQRQDRTEGQNYPNYAEEFNWI